MEVESSQVIPLHSRTLRIRTQMGKFGACLATPSMVLFPTKVYLTISLILACTRVEE